MVSCMRCGREPIECRCPSERPAVFDESAMIPPRRTDPTTSYASTAKVAVKAGSQRARLLETFIRWSDARDGLTDEEAMNLSPRVSPSSEYSKRCSELREAGYIEATGETRRGESGHRRIVSKVTEVGRRAL